METPKNNPVLTMLRTEFQAAITSDRNALTLDVSISELMEKISQTDFIEPFSIYSRSQLRKMHDCLGHISNTRLNDNPLEVARAVDAIRQMLDGLEITMKQSAASKGRIEAARSRPC
jgi:propanediol dehydratase large subunit